MVFLELWCQCGVSHTVQIQRSVISLGGVVGQGRPCPEDGAEQTKEKVTSREARLPPPPLGLRVCDTSLLSKLTPDNKSFCRPWEIWCHL